MLEQIILFQGLVTVCYLTAVAGNIGQTKTTCCGQPDCPQRTLCDEISSVSSKNNEATRGPQDERGAHKS